MKNDSIDRSTLTAFLAVIFIGGFNAIAMRFTLQELAPFWSAVIRFIPAILILFGIVWLKKLPLPAGRELSGAVVFGVLVFGLNFGLMYWGLLEVQPGMAQVIAASIPLVTMLIAVLFRQEVFSRRSLIGSLVALGGILLIFAEQIQTNVEWHHLLAIFGAVVCVSFASVFIKIFPQAHPVSNSAVGSVAGTIVLFLAVLIFKEPMVLPVKAATWGSLVFLIVLGSVAFPILMLFILGRWKASAANYAFVLIPIVTLTASAWINHERLTLPLLLGGLLVIAGTWFGALRAAPKPEPVAAG